MRLPSLTLHPASYDSPQKPVVLLLPTGGVSEFGNLENAQSYLASAKRAGAPGAEEAALFSFDFESREWKRVV